MFDFPDLGGPVQVHVAPDGSVTLPYAGKIQIAGMSPEQFGNAISVALQDRGVVKQPNVTVEVVSAVYLTVNVIGQVNNLKPVPLYAPAPLSYVLSQVNGVNGLAARHITIIHHSDQPPTSVDYDPEAPTLAALNTIVQPGDIVNVSNRGVYFVVGEVNRPGVYPLGGALTVGTATAQYGTGIVAHITLLQGLAQAGGVTAIAARSRMHILRTVDGKREDIRVDQVKLSRGEVADPILKQDDIIYLEPSYFRQQTNNLFSTALSGLYAATSIRNANF